MSTLNQALKDMNRRKMAEAALVNEAVTRRRVEELERDIKTVKRQLLTLEVEQGVLVRGFAGRLRWLVMGR